MPHDAQVTFLLGLLPVKELSSVQNALRATDFRRHSSSTGGGFAGRASSAPAPHNGSRNGFPVQGEQFMSVHSSCLPASGLAPPLTEMERYHLGDVVPVLGRPDPAARAGQHSTDAHGRSLSSPPLASDLDEEDFT